MNILIKPLKRILSRVTAKEEELSDPDSQVEVEWDLDLEVRETNSSRNEQTWRRAYSRFS